MAEVNVQIAGRRYRLGCGDGEEAGLIAYADHMDTIATEIQGAITQPVPEGRHMVMVGLTLADQIAERDAQIAGLERQLADMQRQLSERALPADMFNPEVEAEMAIRVDAIAERIEALTARMI